MDIREDIYTILATMPAQVYQSRIDPLKSEQYPCVNVFYRRKNFKNYAHDFSLFELTADVTIAIAVATGEGYDQSLDTLVDSAMAALLINDDWKNQFKNVSGFDVKYGYDKAGETNLAIATIDLTLVADHQPVLATYPTLNTAIVNFDLGTPSRAAKSQDPRDWESLPEDPNKTEFERVMEELNPPALVEAETDGVNDYSMTIQIQQP